MTKNFYADAYDKLGDLNRRVERLETAAKDVPTRRTLVYNRGYLFAENGKAERTAYFYSLSETDAACAARFSFPVGLTAIVRFYSGGTLVAERYFTLSEAATEFSFTAKKGVNALRTEITLQGYVSEPDEPYKVDAYLEISGILDGKLTEERLTVIENGVLGVKSDDAFSVLRVVGTELKGVATFSGFTEFDMTKLGEGYVAAARDGNKDCYLLFYEPDFTEYRRAYFGNGYTKLAVRIVSAWPVVYAIKGNTLAEINFSDLTPIERITGIRGRDVRYFNAYDSEYLAVTDLLGNVFCYRMRKDAPTNIRRVFALGKLKNLYVPYSGEFTVAFSEGGKVYKRTVSDVCVLGEKEFVADGKQIVVTGNVTAVLKDDGTVVIVS